MKLTVKLLLAGQLLDIGTTLFGVYVLGARELNTLFPLKILVAIKILVTVFVAILLQKLPFEKPEESVALTVVYIAVSIPFIYGIFNLISIFSVLGV